MLTVFNMGRVFVSKLLDKIHPQEKSLDQKDFDLIDCKPKKKQPPNYDSDESDSK